MDPPTTPETPTSNGSSFADPSEDEETIRRRRENVLRVMITFFKALNGEPLGTHRLRMDEQTSIGTFFALAKKHPETNGKSFSLTLGKTVWKDPRDVYGKILQNDAVTDALGACEGDDVELRIAVTFLAFRRPGKRKLNNRG